MILTELLAQLENEEEREIALCNLSAFLLEKRDTDNLFYVDAGRVIYSSCNTMIVMMQETRLICTRMNLNSLPEHTFNRCIHVLSIFQCIVSHPDTREKAIDAYIPNWLIPIITFDSKVEKFENVRSICVSIFWILCEDPKPCIIKWVIDNRLADALKVVLDIGNELSITSTLALIEILLKKGPVLHYICSGQDRFLLLATIIKIWDDVIEGISSGKEFLDRVLFHLLQCSFHLRLHPVGNQFVKEKVQPLLGSLIQDSEPYPHVNKLAKDLQIICDVSSCKNQPLFPYSASN